MKVYAFDLLPWPYLDEASYRAGVFMGLFQFGSLPHALAAKNIELFARTVLPELRRD